MPEQTQIPRVLWAQQRETVLLTIAVPDIEKVDVKFEENSVSFNGQPSADNAKNKDNYAIKIDLYEKIDPEACKYENVGQKFWRILLKKKESTGAFWPRLTKEKTRLHWLQTDFNHWKDDDESDDEKSGPDGNFQDMFSGGMGGMGGMPGMGGMGGMPGMGGMGGMPGMGDFGGMGGMPGMGGFGGMGGMPGMGGGLDDDEEGDSGDEEASPMGTANAQNNEQSTTSKTEQSGNAQTSTSDTQRTNTTEQSA